MVRRKDNTKGVKDRHLFCCSRRMFSIATCHVKARMSNMQAEWELCKENFQPLKRGRKELCKQESKVCQKGDVDSQRRCAQLCKKHSANQRGASDALFVVGRSGKSLTRTMVKICWTSGSGQNCSSIIVRVFCCSDKTVCRFIKWTQDTFRSGGHQAELLPLLERCTRELQHIHKYNSDIRYLRIWIQYVRCAATVLQPALQSYMFLKLYAG